MSHACMRMDALLKKLEKQVEALHTKCLIQGKIVSVSHMLSSIRPNFGCHFMLEGAS